MSTFYGIGTSWRGISEPDANRLCTGTVWFTFLYAPIVPLSRHHSREGATALHHFPFQGLTTEYAIYSNDPLDFKEIVMTYIVCWLLYPLLIIGPLLLMYRFEVSTSLFLTFLWVGWVCIALWFVLPWLSRKLIPNPAARFAKTRMD